MSSVSYDPSEIILICWIGAQETFLLIIIIIKTDVLYNNYLSGNFDTF